ncbi:lysozyme inhibitor LprI family protein [Methylobacterium sp. NEAU 140]|uniref:lysozyme inhibitor LprI family protein n=1 Tax=Methylobacterium sp. NEAU 140 TaxID=3064945 RepID=UPI002734E4C9|nr:lysozyme inhibitor LprI family protein [Methylobacterium sp. NEAU 140]MDP4022772.1 lysozyme inhibitor LprI family protein [Methylobacterium sp. NEAU 140]
MPKRDARAHGPARGFRPVCRLGVGAGLVLGLVVAAAPSRAGDEGYRSCMARSASTYASVQCQTAELARVEAELNATYRTVLSALPQDQQEKLRAAERLWVAFRQSDCDVFYGQQTGTIASIQGGDCMIARARQRIRDLKVFTEP